MQTEVLSGSRAMRQRLNHRVQIRAGRAPDAEACAAICFEGFNDVAERHNFPPDISREMAGGLMQMLFSRSDVRSFIAEIDGKIVGSNFLWMWRPVMGIGPISVAPSAQSSSVGRKLMEAALAATKELNAPGVRLVQATYNTRSLSLYTKLGFETRELLGCFQGPRASVAGLLPTRAATERDLAACNLLCTRVLGNERHEELAEAIAGGAAIVAERDGRIVAYTTGIGFFTHAVAEDNDGLKALITAADTFNGPGFLLPMRNGELVRWCFDRGLRLVQPMTLMSIGVYTEPRGAFLPSILF